MPATLSLALTGTLKLIFQVSQGSNAHTDVVYLVSIPQGTFVMQLSFFSYYTYIFFFFYLILIVIFSYSFIQQVPIIVITLLCNYINADRN